ncbi:hypothetical protein C8A01DRAFT_36625 [Parachaetomium inaequale]|uniref:WD-like domain-containing protein n=1 Tax=Parachaetomium inaequale TaxID=2588326 RepID=A0AAN6PIY9_9PEZI|nr:hypothetical protein C8A01DRAFT_36625 [Parachaetomium inaequale]
MQLKTLTLAALLAAVQVSALPSPITNAPNTAEHGLIILSTTFHDDGGVETVYGADPAFTNTTASPSSPLTRRCGSNTIHCSGSNVPALNTCQDLVARIRTSSNVLNSSPRSICLSRSGRSCCISWATDIGAVHESDLWSAAKKTMDQCVPEGNSGRATDVLINGRCLDQCLSDRATHCT